MKNRTGVRRIGKAASRFAVDYMHRHKHPVNAALHIVGVPAAFYGFWLIGSNLLARPARGENSVQQSNLALGMILVFFGYLFQYLGHRSQGNEVGEVTLIKNISRRFELGNLQAKIWSLLDGGAFGARASAGKTVAKASRPHNGHNGHAKGDSNGESASSPFTSHSLVWWKRQ